MPNTDYWICDLKLFFNQLAYLLNGQRWPKINASMYSKSPWRIFESGHFDIHFLRSHFMLFSNPSQLILRKKDFDSTLLATKNVHYSQKLFWNKKIIPILLRWVFLFPSSNWSAKKISIIILGTLVNCYFVANFCKKHYCWKSVQDHNLLRIYDSQTMHAYQNW